MPNSNLFIKLILIFLVFASAYIAKAIYPANQSAAAATNVRKQYAVNVNKNCVLFDKARERKIPCTIYYPREDGVFPVIIFSHGIGGSKDDYVYLGKFWAEHGYVCIHVTGRGD